MPRARFARRSTRRPPRKQACPGPGIRRLRQADPPRVSLPGCPAPVPSSGPRSAMLSTASNSGNLTPSADADAARLRERCASAAPIFAAHRTSGLIAARLVEPSTRRQNRTRICPSACSAAARAHPITLAWRSCSQQTRGARSLRFPRRRRSPGRGQRRRLGSGAVHRRHLFRRREGPAHADPQPSVAIRGLRRHCSAPPRRPGAGRP